MAPAAQMHCSDAYHVVAASSMDYSRTSCFMHAARQETLLIPNNTCQHEQQQALQRKPMQPLKARSRFYWDSADWALGTLVEDHLPHAQPSRRTSMDRQPSRLSRCSSAESATPSESN